MRSLHTVEEKLYAPELDLPITAMKALLFIRHETIRWENEEASITYSDIMEKTGMCERSAKNAIKILQKKKIIRVIRRQDENKKTLPNIIGLNPDYFGEIIEPTCRPKMSVIEGGKGKKLSTGVNECAPLFTETCTPVDQGVHPEQGQDPLSVPVSSSLKNSLKNPLKNFLGEDVDQIDQGRREAEEAKQKINAILSFGMRGIK